MELEGNFVGEHPFTLIKIIQEEQEEQDSKLVKPIKEEARKILTKNTSLA